MDHLDDRISESWSNISRLFEKNSKAEQDMIKSVFDYAYRAGYNTGYAEKLTDYINEGLNRFFPEEDKNNDLASN